jgi:hypothetical protein
MNWKRIQLYKPPRPTPTMLLSALREWDRRLEFLASSRNAGVVWTSSGVATCIEDYVKRRGYTCWRDSMSIGYRVSIHSGESEAPPVNLYMDIVPSTSASDTVTIVSYLPDGGQIGAPASVDCNSTPAQCESIVKGFLDCAKQLKPSGSR